MTKLQKWSAARARELRTEHGVETSSGVRSVYDRQSRKLDRYEVDVIKRDTRRPFMRHGRVVAIGVGRTEAEARANARIIANAIAEDRQRKREARRRD